MHGCCLCCLAQIRRIRYIPWTLNPETDCGCSRSAWLLSSLPSADQAGLLAKASGEQVDVTGCEVGVDGRPRCGWMTQVAMPWPYTMPLPAAVTVNPPLHFEQRMQDHRTCHMYGSRLLVVTILCCPGVDPRSLPRTVLIIHTPCSLKLEMHPVVQSCSSMVATYRELSTAFTSSGMDSNAVEAVRVSECMAG